MTISKITLITISVIVFLSLLVVRSSPSKKQSEIRYPTTTISPTSPEQSERVVEPDDTTYVNVLHHYQVEVPVGWEIKEGPYAFLNQPGEVTFTPPSEQYPHAFFTQIVIVSPNERIRYTLDTQEQYDEWLAMRASNDNQQRLFKFDEVVVGGISAVQFISRSLPGDATEPFYSITTWFRRDNKNYYIELVSPEEKLVKENLEIYNHLLSTFTFSD